MLGIFFTFFVYFNTYFTCFLSLGSAEADTGRGEKLNSHLMASCIRNIVAENY